MKKLLLFGILFIFMAGFVSICNGTWGGLKWGMTVTEVEDFLKVKLTMASDNKDGTVSYKSPELFNIDKYRLDQRFVFDRNGKLSSVLLSTNADYYECFLYLDSELTKKYGEPRTKEDEKLHRTGPGLAGFEKSRTWITEDTVIMLNLMTKLVGEQKFELFILRYDSRKTDSRL